MSDFKSFERSQEPSASTSSLQKILDTIEAQMPTKQQVFGQLFLVHLISSAFTLMACPQFGMRFIFADSSPSLMEFFMLAGHPACFFLCGAFYLGSTFFVSKYILQADSWLVIQRSRFVMTLTLALLSLGFFRMWGQALSFELTLLWILGAYLGAGLFTREWWKLRLIRRLP